MAKIKDLKGLRFGRLTVLEFYDIKNHNARWRCLCDCGNETIVYACGLKSGKTLSCGCLQRETTSKIHKLYNDFDLSKDYGIGYLSKGGIFYFDLDDYELIKDYYWYSNDNGYILAHNIKSNKPQNVRLHRLVMGVVQDDKIIDHINNKPYDCRKQNLRFATKQTNNINRGANANNKLGIKGVNKNTNSETYTARIMVDSKTIYLGCFNSIDEAKKARDKAEKELFGEFAYKGGDNQNV